MTHALGTIADRWRTVQYQIRKYGSMVGPEAMIDFILVQFDAEGLHKLSDRLERAIGDAGRRVDDGAASAPHVTTQNSQVSREGLRRFRGEMAKLTRNDVQNLSDRSLDEVIDRVFPGFSTDETMSVRVKVGMMRVSGPAGDQIVSAQALLSAGAMQCEVGVVVHAVWNGKDIAYKGMELS